MPKPVGISPQHRYTVVYYTYDRMYKKIKMPFFTCFYLAYETAVSEKIRPGAEAQRRAFAPRAECPECSPRGSPEEGHCLGRERNGRQRWGRGSRNEFNLCFRFSQIWALFC